MNLRLSSVFVAVAAASLLVSTTGIAAQKHKAAPQENYKAETNFKAEVPPPCPPVLMLRDGFYLGIGVGYDSYRVHSDTDLVVSDLTTGIVGYSQDTDTNLSATGWMGGIFAGYGRYFDWFYLGLELNANASNADSSTSYVDSIGNSASLKLKARSSYGVGLLPGIKLNDSSLLYVRLAYLRTNFKANASVTTDSDIDGDFTTVSGSSSEWRNGFQYGVGIETAVAEDVSLRGEYTHTSYNSKTVSESFTDTPNSDVYSLSDKFDVSNNEFMLSLIYHFCL